MRTQKALRFARYGKFALLALLPGCGVFQMLFPIPGSLPDLKAIIGGPTDQRPYFGTVSTVDGSNADFLLATCGCGEWRVLIQDAKNNTQWQFPVNFYTNDGQDRPDGDVTVFGKGDTTGILATLHQMNGTLDGRTDRNESIYLIDATRTETHTDDATACVKCHIGEDPIWPQPPNHPQFQLNPPNCLSCHTVVIE